MSAEIEREKEKIIQEWEQRAKDDLDSAEILLRGSAHFDIAAYHAHQAIEKLIKARLLKKGETFRLIHDINSLFLQLTKNSAPPDIIEKITFVNSLYPRLRYPIGDRITREQAEKCLDIAKAIFLNFRI